MAFGIKPYNQDVKIDDLKCEIVRVYNLPLPLQSWVPSRSWFWWITIADHNSSKSGVFCKCGSSCCQRLNVPHGSTSTILGHFVVPLRSPTFLCFKVIFLGYKTWELKPSFIPSKPDYLTQLTLLPKNIKEPHSLKTVSHACLSSITKKCRILLSLYQKNKDFRSPFGYLISLPLTLIPFSFPQSLKWLQI